MHIGAIAAAVKSAITSSQYRYFRLYITAGNGDAYCSVQEIEIAATIGGADFTTTGMTTNQSDYYETNTFARVIDNSMEYSLACYVSNTEVSYPHWGTIDFGSAMTIKEVRIWPQNYSGGPARAPMDFLIQGSTDNSSWITLSTQTGITGWIAGSSKTFVI